MGQKRCQKDDVKHRGPTRGYRAETRARGRSRRVDAAWSATLAFALACSGAPRGAPGLPIVATPIPPAPATTSESLIAEGAPALDAVLIDHVPEGTFGPYVGAGREGRSLALWAAAAEPDGSRWFSTPLDAHGAPLGKPRSLAGAPSEIGLVSVAGAGSGFVAVATGITPTGTRVEALLLGPGGELLQGPAPLAHSRTEVLWVEALQAGATPLALWATLGVGAADVQLAALSSASGRQSAPVTVLEGATAWQAVEYSDGVALAALVGAEPDATRALVVRFVDGSGRVLGQTELASGARIDEELDAARSGDNLVVSWTQLDAAEARVMLAVIGPDMRLVAAPRPATPPFGRQRLVRLLPASEPRGDALLAWEEVGQAPRGQQRIQIARVDERGRVEPAAAAITFAGEQDQAPELARKGRGLAALTRAVVCARDVSPCSTPDPVPAFVELGGDLEVLASEPLRLAPASGQLADLAWGLSCTAESCSALAALPAAPVPIYGVELRARSQGWTAAARRVGGALPRAIEMRAAAEGDPLADVAAARASDGWLVATLTQFDDSTPYVQRKTPAPDGRLAPVRAVLSVQPFSDAGRSSDARVVSWRARASSGVALAPLANGRALLAWTAIDRQRPEVFATLLGARGQSLSQRMLTTNAGEVSAVGAAGLGRGAVVAWVGDRDGAPRLFAVRLNDDLVRAAPEQRLSPAGGFNGLSVARVGDEIWVLASRRDEREAVLSLLRLDPTTAARRGDELILQRSETGAFASPALVDKAGGALLGWVERPLIGGEEPRAWLLELDSAGARRGEARVVASEAGEPTALRLSCDQDACRGVLDARPPEGASIEGFDWDEGAPPASAPGSSAASSAASSPVARRLVHRFSTSADPPALALAGTALLYADRDDLRGLLRRAAIAWRGPEASD